jgi:N-acetylglutamate synthase-like GNAT family acetyltransferase
VNAATLRTPKLIAFPLAAWERDGLKASLRNAKLPTDDLDAEGPLFWRFETAEGTPVGFGGLEIHGPDALLRSVVTLPPQRGHGFGHAIVAALEAEAAMHGRRALYLLTTTEKDFFARLGYVSCARDRVPAAIRASTQFASLCPASAAVMMKRLS